MQFTLLDHGTAAFTARRQRKCCSAHGAGEALRFIRVAQVNAAATARRRARRCREGRNGYVRKGVSSTMRSRRRCIRASLATRSFSSSSPPSFRYRLIFARYSCRIGPPHRFRHPNDAVRNGARSLESNGPGSDGFAADLGSMAVSFQISRILDERSRRQVDAVCPHQAHGQPRTGRFGVAAQGGK